MRPPVGQVFLSALKSYLWWILAFGSNIRESGSVPQKKICSGNHFKNTYLTILAFNDAFNDDFQIKYLGIRVRPQKYFPGIMVKIPTSGKKIIPFCTNFHNVFTYPFLGHRQCIIPRFLLYSFDKYNGTAISTFQHIAFPLICRNVNQQ